MFLFFFKPTRAGSTTNTSAPLSIPAKNFFLGFSLFSSASLGDRKEKRAQDDARFAQEHAVVMM